MKSIKWLYIVSLAFCVSTFIFIFGGHSTSQFQIEFDNYRDFDDPFVVSLIKARSYPIHLPISTDFLRYLYKCDGRMIFQLHNEIVSWYRSPQMSSFSMPSYSSCTCGRISESCSCVIQLIKTPIPIDKTLGPDAYHSLIGFSESYANFNFDIKFDTDQRTATVSGFINRASDIDPQQFLGETFQVFRNVSIDFRGVPSLCAHDQNNNEDLPQVSLCLTLFNVKNGFENGTEILSWCANASILVNNRLLLALYPLGCIKLT
ncbi:hypothetical protein Aperf_G00000104926 [Anoplocephala perfoliata]